jgi:hypothetical protein
MTILSIRQREALVEILKRGGTVRTWRHRKAFRYFSRAMGGDPGHAIDPRTIRALERRGMLARDENAQLLVHLTRIGEQVAMDESEHA